MEKDQYINKLEDDLEEAVNLLEKAQKVIRSVIDATWSEGWSYSLCEKAKAEEFIREVDAWRNA